MITVTAVLKGISPYGQSAPFHSEKKAKELHKDFEERVWMERAHINSHGMVYIPAMALKNCIADAAKYLAVRIPGKGTSTYTKHFEAGVLVVEDAVLNVSKDQIIKRLQFVPSDGKRGGGKRVWKSFPVVAEGWETTVEFLIFDETITQDVFEMHLRQAGNFIGLGWFRPRNNGTFGRFKVESLKWVESD